ncbi:MAG: hypothetical protein ACPG7F_16385 [Aggregatilineales bacterium]
MFNFFQNRKNYIRAIAILIAIVALGSISVFAIDEITNSTINVSYYGELTSFEELETNRKIVHCVTDTTDDLKARGIFDIALDRVICFDTISEADSFFYRQNPEYLE